MMANTLRTALLLFDAIVMFFLVAYLTYVFTFPIWMVLILSIIAAIGIAVAASRFDTKDLFLKNLGLIAMMILVGYLMYSVYTSHS